MAGLTDSIKRQLLSRLLFFAGLSTRFFRCDSGGLAPDSTPVWRVISSDVDDVEDEEDPRVV